MGVHNIKAGSAKLPGVPVNGVLALDAGCLSSLSTSEQLILQAVLLPHQHYDHLRDLPTFGMNLSLNNASGAVYGPSEMQGVLRDRD